MPVCKRMDSLCIVFKTSTIKDSSNPNFCANSPLDFNISMDINDNRLINYSRNANFYSTFLQDDWKLSSRLNLQTGLRMAYYDSYDIIIKQ